MKKIKLNVLSLFDGIGCAKLALKKSKNIEINRYFYSEIDKNCLKLLSKKYPKDINLGSVENINLNKLPRIDLLIGGSPCQDLSNAYRGDGIKVLDHPYFFNLLR